MELELSLSELHVRQLEMLRYIKQICEENRITYFLDGGTLLGAVRNHDFIPWDDDADVLLWRNDYEKLILLLKKQKGRFAIMDISMPAYPLPYAKLIDRETRLTEPGNKPIEEYGLFLDIFPLDTIPDKRFSALLFVSWGLLKRKIARAASQTYSQKSFFKQIGVNILTHFDAHPLAVKANKFAQSFTGKSRYAVSMFGIKRPMLMKTKWFEKSETVLLANIEFNVPKGYDKYLREMYGDYMVIPPVTKRQSHHVQVYKK